MRFRRSVRGYSGIFTSRSHDCPIFVAVSRLIRTDQHLRENGQGNLPPAGSNTFLPSSGASLSTRTFYDGNSRTKQLVDDRGGVTAFTYDTLDRQVKLIFHDGSERVNEYDEAGDVVTYTDENGSGFTNTFDAVGRKTAVSISLASGVIGTTAQSFQYDGLSRSTFLRDSISGTHADVILVYDSLSRVLEDSQTYGGNTRNVSNTAFTSNPVTEFTFPNDRETTNTYDLLYRRSLVEETSGGADIAAWQFFGPGRLAEVVLGNGLIVTWMNNTRTRSAIQAGLSTPGWGDQSSDRLGYDGAGRMIGKRVLQGGINGGTFAYNNTTAVVGWTTEFDKASNKFYERALHAESRSHLYEPIVADAPQGGYDSLNRLRQYQRGTLASGGESVSSVIALPNTDEFRTYDLDGLGNWRKTVFEPVGGSETTQVRQHNYLNEITRTRIASTNNDFSYDGVSGASNGNVADDGVRTYEWDALNRLKMVYKTPSSPSLIGEYTYDALGRRIRKVITNGGLSGTIPNGTTDYLYNTAWQCVEERDGSNDPTKQYVWGMYIDELIQVNIQDSPDLDGGFYYPLQDLLYRTQLLTWFDQSQVEAYDYDAYGNTLIFDERGTGSNWWANDASQTAFANCEVLFTGQRFDPESQLYICRTRIYNPILGRFLSKDSNGFASPWLNLFEYTRCAPIKFTDPSGRVLYPAIGLVLVSNPVAWAIIGLVVVAVLIYLIYRVSTRPRPEPLRIRPRLRRPPRIIEETECRPENDRGRRPPPIDPPIGTDEQEPDFCCWYDCEVTVIHRGYPPPPQPNCPRIQYHIEYGPNGEILRRWPCRFVLQYRPPCRDS